MKFSAGVDGGGTGTVLELRSETGEVIKRERFGPFNLNSIGGERFSLLLNEIFGTVTAAGECLKVCIGAAGVSNPEVKRLVEESAGRFGLQGKIILRGDHEIALYGATGGKPGGILIAGTGSICAGMKADGEVIRAGGWGHIIDDGGSGYALGRDALSAVVQAHDGRRRATALTALVLEKLSIADIGGIIAKVYGAPDKSLVASLSTVVEQAGRLGDEAALEILQKNAADLAGLAQAVYNRLGIEEMNLSLLGGVLLNDTLLRRFTIDAVHRIIPAAHIVPPATDAAGGAALMASTFSQPRK